MCCVCAVCVVCTYLSSRDTRTRGGRATIVTLGKGKRIISSFKATLRSCSTSLSGEDGLKGNLSKMSCVRHILFEPGQEGDC